MFQISYINVNNVDIQELLKRLHKLGFQESYLNDFRFCPYFIIYKNPDTNKTPKYKNINEGYLNHIKSNYVTTEYTDISDFIDCAAGLFQKDKIGLF